ncbi:hypothetical protein FKM82_007854 [Ascaphus truei]
MEVLVFNLQRAPDLRCESQTSLVTLCQTCETCVLTTKAAVTKEWFVRAGESSQRKFLFGIIRRVGDVGLLSYIENVLHPTLGKDFTYSRSRANPSLAGDLSTSSSDRALSRHLLQQFMAETWEWFKCRSYWTKANYALLLLQLCNSHLLHNAANLTRVLLVREMWSCSAKEEAAHRSQQENLGIKKLDGMKESNASSQPMISDDPSLMVVPTSFKAASGVSKYKDFVRCLPVHLSKRILGLLNKKSLVSCSFVSRHWSYLAEDIQKDLDAERLVQDEAMILQGTSYKGVSASYAKIQQIQVPTVGEDGNIIPQWEKKLYQAVKPGDGLEGAYADIETETVLLEERNLFCGSYNVLILTGHGDPNRVIHFGGGRFVAVGSVDRKVRLLDTVEMKEVSPLIHGHAGSVRAVHLCEDRGFVVSGGFDLSIRQWNLHTGTCMKIFHGHMKTITCVDVHGDMLVSGAKDFKVKVWNITTGKCLRTFKHADVILSVKMKGQRVVSGCEKGLVKVWHVESASLLKTLSGHSGPIKCLSFDQWHLVSGSADGYAIAWSMMGTLKKPLMTFRHPKPVLCLEFLYLRVITGCADGKIRVFNFLNGDCLRLMRANSRADPVVSLCITDNRMVINALTSVLVFQFEDVSWDYTQASERVDVFKERDKYKSAPIRAQPYRNVRAQRMKRVGSSNRKIYQQPEEHLEGKSRLSHHARSLSARSMKRAQDLHVESLKPATWSDLRSFRRSFAYIDLQPEFHKKLPSASRPRTAGQCSPAPFSRASSAPELKAQADSDAESGYASPVPRSGLSVSEEATLQRMRKRGPHNPMSPNQILLKLSAMQNSQKSDTLSSNLAHNAGIRDAWGPPPSHQEHKGMVPRSKSQEHHKVDPFTHLQRIKTSGAPVAMKNVATPFEVRKLRLKLKESLHGPEVRSSIPPPTVVRSQSCCSYKEKNRGSVGWRRSSSAAGASFKQIGHFTSCEAVQPLRMVMGQTGREPCPKREKAEQVVAANPYREGCGFQLLTVKQLKEYEAETMFQRVRVEENVQAGKNKESKKAWLTKIQGRNIDDFTKEGKISAPELGPDAFV